MNQPFEFLQFTESVGVDQVSYSLAPNNTFFRTLFVADDPADFAIYGFLYLWSNDSDSAMLVNVSSALVLFGNLYAEAVSGEEATCWDAWVECDAAGILGLGIPMAETVLESRISSFGAVVADDGFLGFGINQNTKYFEHEDHGLSVDSFLVPPNSQLLIIVGTQFAVSFSGAHTGASSGNWVSADFVTRDQCISCPGVVVLASPVQTT